MPFVYLLNRFVISTFWPSHELFTWCRIFLLSRFEVRNEISVIIDLVNKFLWFQRVTSTNLGQDGKISIEYKKIAGPRA